MSETALLIISALIVSPSVPSPWQRYRQLVEVMIWMDIIASVSLNRVSRLLPTYRNLLGHLPVMSLSHPKLSMERVMGGDSTTVSSSRSESRSY